MKLFPAFLGLVLTQSLLAGPFLEETLFITNIEVQGRLVTHSCSYYSNTQADLKVLFKSDPVDYGTRIFVEYRWANKNDILDNFFPMDHRSEQEMKNFGGAWQAELSQTVAERSSPVFLTRFQFIFRIEEPGKKPRYQAGPESRDTYVVTLPPLESANCVGPNNPTPDFEPLTVQIVRP